MISWCYIPRGGAIGGIAGGARGGSIIGGNPGGPLGGNPGIIGGRGIPGGSGIPGTGIGIPGLGGNGCAPT